MKTTIYKISLCFIFSMLLFSCAADFDKKIRGNKNVITQEREVTNTFNNISVSQGIKLFVSMSENRSIHVTADENLQAHIKTEIKNGILKIYVDGYITTSKSKEVYITIPEINKIKCSSGSLVYSENILMSENLEVKSSSGSCVDIEIDTQNLSVDTSSGSTVKIKGKTYNYNSESSSGSSIKSYKLISQHVNSRASSGSTTCLNIVPKGSLKAKASSGASILYKGTPYTINKSTSSGGNVSKR